jgi:hypothetical protein
LIAGVRLDKSQVVIANENGPSGLDELNCTLSARNLRAVLNWVNDFDLGGCRHFGCSHMNGIADVCDVRAANLLCRVQFTLPQNEDFVDLRVFQEISGNLRISRKTQERKGSLWYLFDIAAECVR